MLDEFDRVTDPVARAAMADTIKSLSDQSLPVTIVLVGISEDALSLIDAHPSVERAIVPIHVPRMSAEELREAFGRALKAVGLSCVL